MIDKGRAAVARVVYAYLEAGITVRSDFYLSKHTLALVFLLGIEYKPDITLYVQGSYVVKAFHGWR
jgi:hypothetical protein